MATTHTKGVCRLCGQTFDKPAMLDHFKACVERSANQGKKKPVAVFHIEVDGDRDLPMYWLHLLARSSAQLSDLDSFLRDIWLECCGHMSQFEINAENFVVSAEGSGERSMNVKLTKVLKAGSTLGYEYDFGSTTSLRLRVVDALEYPMKARSNVELVARNDPPKLKCSKCGKPAAEICTDCQWSGKGLLCPICAGSHRCGEEMLLPVVNSPRCGVCGYTGPVEEESALAVSRRAGGSFELSSDLNTED